MLYAIKDVQAAVDPYTGPSLFWSLSTDQRREIFNVGWSQNSTVQAYPSWRKGGSLAIHFQDLHSSINCSDRRLTLPSITGRAIVVSWIHTVDEIDSMVAEIRR
jgi:hypothetical protein